MIRILSIAAAALFALAACARNPTPEERGPPPASATAEPMTPPAARPMRREPAVRPIPQRRPGTIDPVWPAPSPGGIAMPAEPEMPPIVGPPQEPAPMPARTETVAPPKGTKATKTPETGSGFWHWFKTH